ncbi:hypothetical protein BGZ88_012616 [Linnemannia elongata]|nr:hypothetical protein BGZ88_012616 [Linnemannia elongata]
MRPSSSSHPLPLTSAILLFLVTLTTTPTLTLASITCESPTSGTTVNPGDSLTFRWGDSGSFPKSGDVYSADATVSCSGGSQVAKVTGISNGQSWTVPRDVLSTCGGGGGLQVTLSGSHYDLLHWTHWYSFEAQCGSVEVDPVPVTTTTTTTTTTTAATTMSSDAPVTTATTASGTTPTLSTATPTISVTSTVSGTIPGVLPPSAPGAANPLVTGLNSNSNDPSSPSSIISTSSSSPDSPSKTGGPSKAALGALGAVGGLAAIAILIFGLILRKRRQRRRAREERWMDHNYSSPSMSEHKNSGTFNSGGGKDYAFSGPGAGGAAGLYTAYHNPDTTSSSASKSTECVIPQPTPPADQKGDVDNDQQQQHEKSTPPIRPARTYQGDFDDPTTPWDGQLGYLQPFSSQQASTSIGATGENLDLGYEYIQDYIPSDATYQHDNPNNNNRQLSMRASTQLPEDLEYYARLREASWPLPPTSLPHHRSHQPHPDACDADASGAGTSLSRNRCDAKAAPAGGDQLLALNGDSVDIDVVGNGGGGGNGIASTTASAAAAADRYRLLSMRYL